MQPCTQAGSNWPGSIPGGNMGAGPGPAFAQTAPDKEMRISAIAQGPHRLMIVLGILWPPGQIFSPPPPCQVCHFGVMLEYKERPSPVLLYPCCVHRTSPLREGMAERGLKEQFRVLPCPLGLLCACSLAQSQFNRKRAVPMSACGCGGAPSRRLTSSRPAWA